MEDNLTPQQINQSIRRSLSLEHSWQGGLFKATLREAESIPIERDYPASEIGGITYFRGTNLVMILIGDPDTDYIRYVTIYEVSPPRKLAEWDVGNTAQIICAKALWVSLGGSFKRLVVAASIAKERWHDPDRLYSLEVASLDLEDHFRGQPSRPRFEPLARVYWRHQYTNIVLSDSICGGIGFTEGLPIVITYLDWKSGTARSVLVDAADYYDMQQIGDFTSDVQFDFYPNPAAEVFLWNNWIGLLQVTKPTDLRYFLTPVQFNASETVSVGASFPSFERRSHAVAIGNNPDRRCIVSLGEFAINGRVGDDMILQLVSGDNIISRDVVITVDFRPLYADLIQLERSPPGFYRLSSPKIQNRKLPESPVLAINAENSSSVMFEGDWQRLRITQYRPTVKREARVIIAEEDMLTEHLEVPNDLDDVEGVFFARDAHRGFRLFHLE